MEYGSEKEKESIKKLIELLERANEIVLTAYAVGAIEYDEYYSIAAKSKYEIIEAKQLIQE